MEVFGAFLKGSIDLTAYKAQLSSLDSIDDAYLRLEPEVAAERAGVALDEFIRAFPKLRKMKIITPTVDILPVVCKALSVHKSVTDLAFYNYVGRPPTTVFGGDLDAMREFAEWLCSDDRPEIERLSFNCVDMSAEGATILLEAMLSECGPPIRVLDDGFWWLLEQLPLEAAQSIVLRFFTKKICVRVVDAHYEIPLGLLAAMFEVLGSNTGLERLKLHLRVEAETYLSDEINEKIGEALAANSSLRELSI